VSGYEVTPYLLRDQFRVLLRSLDTINPIFSPLSLTSATCVIVFYTAVGLTYLSALLLCLIRFLHAPSSVLLFTLFGGQFLSIKHNSLV
jgi:hypothetical protein